MVVYAADSTAPTGWLGVDWDAIGLVFVVGLVVTVVVATVFALATRLLAVGAPDIEPAPGEEPDGPNAVVRPRLTPRPASATVGAWLLYAVAAAVVVYGIYLVIPLFHQS
jgi:hypothetical protein